ncbi:MAG: hypothetical protein ACYSXF_06405 [Planctomycetota bacterium]|jgi:hypothetical protein
MRIRSQAFHVPKRGNEEAEYEDAVFPDGAGKCEVPDFRCAVADGASESAFAAEWAQLLVRGFGRRKLHLEQLTRVWQRLVDHRPRPWYVEAKIGKGAHAALLGLSIREASKRCNAEGNGKPTAPPEWVREIIPLPPQPETGRWRALAVGDTCLFQVRKNNLLQTGPVSCSEDFDNSPFLVSTKTPEMLRRGPHVKILSGTWESGDHFYLATDALAKWILSEHEAGRPPWKILDGLRAKSKKKKSFAEFVEKMRSAKALHNDDTTLLRIKVS